MKIRVVVAAGQTYEAEICFSEPLSERAQIWNCDVFLHIDVNPGKTHLQYRQNKECAYQVALRSVRATIVVVEKQ
jgi:hypothetical protein